MLRSGSNLSRERGRALMSSGLRRLPNCRAPRSTCSRGPQPTLGPQSRTCPSPERAAPSCPANRAAFPIREPRRRRVLLRTSARAILPRTNPRSTLQWRSHFSVTCKYQSVHPCPKYYVMGSPKAFSVGNSHYKTIHLPPPACIHTLKH